MIMKKKDPNEKYYNKWVLLDKKGNVIYFSDNVADVYNKGREYPLDSVIIEKRFEPGTCFF